MAYVTFDVFSSKWDAMTPTQQYQYVKKYYVWLCAGNKPVVSVQGDGLSKTYALSEVKNLLEFLKLEQEESSGPGFMTIQPNLF